MLIFDNLFALKALCRYDKTAKELDYDKFQKYSVSLFQDIHIVLVYQQSC